MKKKILISVLTIAATALLVSCACDMATTSPSPSAGIGSGLATPMASPSQSPDVSQPASQSPGAESSQQPSQSPGEGEGSSSAGGVDTESIRTEVEKLSEVKSAEVAVFGDAALIGLSFDDAYQGTLTARITEMVTEQVQGVQSDIKDVRVTADQTLMEEIKSFADKNYEPDSSQAQSEFDTLKARLEPAS